MLELARSEGRTPASAGELMNDPQYLFLHDLPNDVAAESVNHIRNQAKLATVMVISTQVGR